MADDRIAIFESKEMNLNPCAQNQFPLFLGKIKLPKDWHLLPCKYISLLVLKTKYLYRNHTNYL